MHGGRELAVKWASIVEADRGGGWGGPLTCVAYPIRPILVSFFSQSWELSP